jgi:hypothetical protein
MDKVNGGVSFRWDGEQMLVTTPQAQYQLNAEQTMDLMTHLYENRDRITEALHRLPGWARPEQTTTNVAEERPKRLPEESSATS